MLDLFNQILDKVGYFITSLTQLIFIYSVIGNAKPTITPAERHLVIELNKPFELHCRGEKEMQWQREDRPTQRQRGEKRVVGMSTLHISRAQPVHMGRYICLEKSSGERASIYIYVRGSWML